MNSVVSNLYQLTADDLAGIHFLYGAPTPTPTPTPSATPMIPSRLVNLSTRMEVGLGDNVLIGGFIIQGDKRKKVLLRALGPSLRPTVWRVRCRIRGSTCSTPPAQ